MIELQAESSSAVKNCREEKVERFDVSVMPRRAEVKMIGAQVLGKGLYGLWVNEL